MNDYERIAAAIRYLEAHQQEQPDLESVARSTGLSASHFHRLFSTWAGITPKDFLQCLTLEHAKELLRRGESVLNAALETGLSGPGRLHDLCIHLDAASPGEWKSGGQSWRIAAGFADTPFGKCLVAESPRGICHLSFLEEGGEASAWEELKSEWPLARVSRDDAAAQKIIRPAFARRNGAGSAPLRAFVTGTPFQIRVWRALLRVPPGYVVSYGRIAEAIGHPTALRAVGSAVGRNPIAYLIPCHRVIRETGVFGGYHWDPVRKRAMLAWESGRKRLGPSAEVSRG